ncbi:DUF4465 domain-containing protein [Flavobacterium sp. NKUCC04_CG]|uniref:DUF4465 domain-containing protein n=1 Tax=Flavobacterium sp. NKUCC04_CG TaxID=2842121 RepID=UPI001C5AD14E|nr:DUF4465 domain-containing protein [Flavobacterium sp. NKUCC04_CG]MBW3518962.1 DUF4465 domain-containing protein [Flavobacterium sp. NKUCC04_CG]
MMNTTIKTKNKNLFYGLVLFLFLGLGLNSCSSDDSSIPSAIEQVIRVDDNPIATKPFQFTPKNTFPENTKFFWYSNNVLISEELSFTHIFTKEGEQRIALRTVENGTEQFYAYIFKVLSANTNYVTLDLSTFDLSNGQATAGGTIWSKTYEEDAELHSGIFQFNHSAFPEYYTWMGFTVSNSNDNSNQINQEGGWLQNQWGSMAQGGVKGKGTPFLVSFADHKPDASLLQQGEKIAVERFSSTVKITDSKNQYAAKSVSLAISPWPYYGVLHGDDYSRKFVKGDFFAVHVYGVNKAGILSSEKPVTHYFVDFRNEVGTISQDWNKVDLSSLGEVEYLLFFLETTDVGQWGANTALYFTMDQLTVDKIN